MQEFLFGIFPYIALTVLAVGSIARYERDPATWKSSSSQLLRRKQLIWGSVLFHVGVLVIFFGHLFGLLLPITLYEALGVGLITKQLMAALGGGLAGVLALTGGLMLAHRRLFDPRVRATSSWSDTTILLLLLAQLLLGLMTVAVSLQNLDGVELAELMAWANGILFKAHIVLGLTIFVLFPFTRLVHMLSAPVRYLWRPGYQIVRTRKAS